MIEPRTRANNGMLWMVAGILALLLFSCIISVMGVFFFMNAGKPSTGSRAIAVAPNSSTVRSVALPTLRPFIMVATPEGGIDYASAVLMNTYAQVSPSVVNVTVLETGATLKDVAPTHPFNQSDLVPVSTGSGFVWDVEGHIVTNNHVVAGADQVQVTFSDESVAVAEVIGIDVDSDLAVLKIDPAGYNLVPVKVGNVDDVRVGMRVAAIGNPFGLQGTLTSGIVSAMGRSIPGRENYSIPNSIQTDAAINPGNSGGPLLNDRGEVIGVNAQIRSEREANSGVGFALPISIVQRVVPALITSGAYRHSYVGVGGKTLSPICAEDLGLPKATRGAYVNAVVEGAPAERAGLHAGNQASHTKYVSICPQAAGGDVILAVNDQRVLSFDDVLIYMERYTSPGDIVTFKVLRSGKEMTVDVTLDERPKSLTP